MAARSFPPFSLFSLDIQQHSAIVFSNEKERVEKNKKTRGSNRSPTSTNDTHIPILFSFFFFFPSFLLSFFRFFFFRSLFLHMCIGFMFCSCSSLRCSRKIRREGQEMKQ